MSDGTGVARHRAGVAQLVAQTTCNRQVVGSIPTAGSIDTGSIGMDHERVHGASRMMPGQRAARRTERTEEPPVSEHRWTIIAVASSPAVLLASRSRHRHQDFSGLLTLIPVRLALEWGPLLGCLAPLLSCFWAATDVLGGPGTTTDGVVVRSVGVAAGVAIGADVSFSRDPVGRAHVLGGVMVHPTHGPMSSNRAGMDGESVGGLTGRSTGAWGF